MADKYTDTPMLGIGGAMRNYIGLIVGLAAFTGWLSIVGNPHVVETVIGLVLGVGAGLWVHFNVRRASKEPQ